MRIGINIPFANAQRQPLTGAEVIERVQMVEAAGLDGIYHGEGMNLGRPDLFMWLALAASASKNLEVGVGAAIPPRRRVIDFAREAATLEALAPGRISIGVGAGSTPEADDIDRSNFEQRFKLLYQNSAAIRSLLAEDPPMPDGSVRERPMQRWAPIGTTPRFFLAAWHSPISLKRAVAEFDGWMCSAFRTGIATIEEAIKIYRDLGGTRVVMSTCLVDLRANKKITDDDSYYLQCPPEEATERLGRLAEAGVDDLCLVKDDMANPAPPFYPDYTMEDLLEIRSLLPKDERKKPWE